MTAPKQSYYIKDKACEKWPHLYDSCPICGNLKTKRGELCHECRVGPKVPDDVCHYCGPSCLFGASICHCGCGGRTNKSQCTRKSTGSIKGKPNKFLLNHHRIQIRQEDKLIMMDGDPCFLVSITQGLFAIVDADDYDRVSRFLWFACKRIESTIYVGSGRDADNISLHRFIMNVSSSEIVDHINGNGLDNRKKNLRICSHSENMRNRFAMGRLSRFKGIRFNKQTNKWVASLNLGSFKTEEEAARSYDRALMQIFPEFGKPNFQGDKHASK